jgi:Protein of unknown function (DUF3106)
MTPAREFASQRSLGQDRRMKRRILITLALAGMLSAQLVFAQSWSDLNPRQQQQLSDFQSIWSQLPSSRRAQLMGSAGQIARMSPTNRRKLVESMLQAAGGNAGAGDSSFGEFSGKR